MKYHNGNPRGRNNIWIVGLIARESGTLLLFPVDKRDSKLLLTIIEKRVEKCNDGVVGLFCAYCLG